MLVYNLSFNILIYYSTFCSCSWDGLFTEGYLILERPNQGIQYKVAKLLYDHRDDDHDVDLVCVQFNLNDSRLKLIVAIVSVVTTYFEFYVFLSTW